MENISVGSYCEHQMWLWLKSSKTLSYIFVLKCLNVISVIHKSSCELSFHFNKRGIEFYLIGKSKVDGGMSRWVVLGVERNVLGVDE